MSYADELCRLYNEEQNKVEDPKEVVPPRRAYSVFVYRDPQLTYPKDVVVEVMLNKATKTSEAQWFVWRFGAWAVRREEEAQAVIEWAKEERERKLAEAARSWKVQNYVDHCRSIRNKRQAKADRDALLDSIEEAALRMTLKAKTLEERMAINDEKEQLEAEVYEAFPGLDDGDDSESYKYEYPDIPEAWIIIAANPSKSQYNLNI